MSAPRKRKPQQQRRTEMRARLIEATLTCLERYGHHGSSLTRILNTAGVSRGAWHHYFATKNDLVAAAAEHALKQTLTTTLALSHNLPSQQQGLDHLFDFIWENFYTGRHRAVWLELNVACRTQASLRQRLTPIMEEFHAEIEKAWEEHFTTTAQTRIPVAAFIALTINALRGMAVQSIAQDDQAYYKKLRSYWISIMAPLIQRKEKHRPADVPSSG
jgi:AcrR family transcriptional regulator